MRGVSNLDLRLMQVFLTVVESRGFVAAQTTLNLGLSTISSHISTLEKRLGVKLCNRGRGGFRLTEEGQKVYEIARRLSGTMSAASSELASLRNLLEGKLRIGIVDNVINNPQAAIHKAIHLFDKREHEVAVTVEIVSPRDLERQVADGILEVGVGPRINGRGTLDYTLLFNEHQYLYCGRLHPLFNDDPGSWTLKRIASEKYASHVCPLPVEPEFTQVLQNVTTAHNMEGVAILILSGRFIGFLPQHYAQNWELAGDLKRIHPDRYHYENSFYLMCGKDQPHNKIVNRFRSDVVKSKLQ